MRAQVAQYLLPAVRDQGWFFDTELLVVAQRDGLRIHEVAVDWVEDPDSRVNIPRTVLTDLRGVLRMRRQSQFARSGQRPMRSSRRRSGNARPETTPHPS